MLLVYLSAAFIGGIVAESLVHLPLVLWAWWMLLPAGALLVWRKAALRTASLCVLAFLLGAIRFSLALAPPDEHSLALLNDHGDIEMIGAVADPPDVRDRSTYLRVSIQRVQVEDVWLPLSGMALVEAPREVDVRYGDLIEFFGEPETPFETEDFSYRDYLARQGIYSLVRANDGIEVISRGDGNFFFAALYTLRDRAFTTIQRLFPEPAASLLAGILLGLDSSIPRDLHDAFAATNTLHIVAISGFNIAIIAGILSQFARRLFSPVWATITVIVGLAAYTLFVGASASVVRAAIMGSLSVLALYYHRQNDAINALAVAALGMCAINPFTLFDLGFQLSFLATLGLVLYTEPLTKAFEKLIARMLDSTPALPVPREGLERGEVITASQQRAQRMAGILSDSFFVTLAAQITTIPLILFTFHRLSIVGLLTNLLILPAQPPVMILGGIATTVGMIIQPLGQVFAWIAWAFLEWTIVIVQATADIPLASIETGRLDVILIGLWYLILFAAMTGNLGRVTSRITLRPAVASGAALVVGVMMWSAFATLPDGRTRIIFIDAGGPATLVQTPAGNKILIDGGSNPSAILAVLGQHMPFWDRRIDLVVLTNAEDRQLSGLIETLERYEVGQIVRVKEPAKTSAAYVKWRDVIALKTVASVDAQADLRLAVDRGVTLELLHSSDGVVASPSAIAQMRAGDVTLLFAEGASVEDQTALLKMGSNIESTVLIAPKKIAPGFLDAVNPQYSVIFSGSSARDKPSADLLTVLSRTTMLDTSMHGTVEMIVDGEGLSIILAR